MVVKTPHLDDCARAWATKAGREMAASTSPTRSQTAQSPALTQSAYRNTMENNLHRNYNQKAKDHYERKTTTGC